MELKLRSIKSKEKFIRISRKERNLLLILGAVILFWLSYRFVFTPQLNKIDKLKKEKLNYEAELKNLEELKVNGKNINQEWLKLKEEYAKSSRKYFPNINQPEIMHLLNEVIDAGKIKVASMNFKEPEIVKLEGLDASFIGVSLPFIGSYGDLEAFISLLLKNPQKLLINHISLFRESGGSLTGQIGVDVFSYGNEVAMKDGYFYTNAYNIGGKADPFIPYDGYVETIDITDETVNDEIEDIKNRTIINDMEKDDIYFMSTASEVTGNVSMISKAKYDKTSVRIEYYMSTGCQTERAYILLDDKDIILNYPPKSIGEWIYAYGYSPVTLGMRLQDMDGRKIDVELAKGVNWTGWKYISAVPPQDINIYPLKLDRIYLDLGPNRDNYGVMLFDRIEADYEVNNETKDNENYIFYVVKPGDTLMSISESIYGVKTNYKRLAKDNGLDPNAILETGKVLVISR